MHEALIRSLRLAVEAAPGDVPLRVHLGRLLVEAGRVDEALVEATSALTIDHDDADARSLMRDVLASTLPEPADDAIRGSDVEADATTATPPGTPRPDGPSDDFDWISAEDDLRAAALRIDRPGLRLDDVAGMSRVKASIDAAFLAPLRNPELRRLFGSSLRGGLLMYGPPGCGKTFLARAVAGELGASFLTVGIAELVDPMAGGPELAVRRVFDAARRHAPCVLFLDELDAMGPRRSGVGGGGLRGVVNQLLAELDGVADDNDGVFVLGATNRPWDVEPALRRPGRFDRTVLVLPPDLEARRDIARLRFVGKPVDDLDLDALARRTAGMSGADVGYVCDLAVQRALSASVRSGVTRNVSQRDLRDALSQVKPSIATWSASARNVVAYGTDDGTFDELRAYLKNGQRS